MLYRQFDGDNQRFDRALPDRKRVERRTGMFIGMQTLIIIILVVFMIGMIVGIRLGRPRYPRYP